MSEKRKLVLCPFCGHAQRKQGPCEQCGGHFDAHSRQVIQTKMGPWFLRDEQLKFIPGVSYATLRDLVRAKQMTPATILRGPATHQFWCAAKNAPGLAHLVGYCHSCHAEIGDSETRCPECAVEFKSPKEFDEVGLIYKSPEQVKKAQEKLERDIEAAGDTPPPYEPDRNADGKVLCPYCGHCQDDTEKCGSCGGLFEPLSRRATQIAMGPWFIRDKKNPFKPGCSYDVMVDLARKGRIKPNTVMRGPSTKQFWSVARNVQGISHLLGYCHSCGEHVKPFDAACNTCGAAFDLKWDRNRFGLPFATASAAADARRELEQQVAAAEHQQAQQEEAYEEYEEAIAVDDVENYDSEHQWEDMAEAVVDEDHSLAAIAAHTHEPAHAFAHDQVEDHAPAPELPIVADDGSGENRALNRRVARLQRQNQAAIKTLIAVGIITPIVFVAGFILLSGDNDNPATKDGVTTTDSAPKDGQPKDNGKSKKEFFNDDQLAKKTALEKVWTRVKTIRPTGGVKPVYEHATAMMKQSDQLWSAHQFTEWEQKLPEFEKAVNALEAWLLDRDEALRAKEAAAIAMRRAKDGEADVKMKHHWDAAKALVSEAVGLLDSQTYEASADKYWAAQKKYFEALDKTKKSDFALTQKERYVKRLTENFEQAQIDNVGGDPWKRVAAHYDNAEKAFASESFDVAIAEYQDAYSAIPPMEKFMRRIIGVHHFAFVLGHYSADVWLRQAAGKELNEEKLTNLRNRFEDVLMPQLEKLLPSNPKAPAAELGAIVMEKIPLAIEAQRTEPVAISYLMGVRARVIERLLQVDREVMPKDERDALNQSVDIMRQYAQLASYHEPFFKELDAFVAESKIVPEFEAIQAGRLKWAGIIRAMNDHDSAMEWVPAGTLQTAQR